VLDAARRIGDKIIDGRDVALEVSAAPEAGLAVYADRLQLEVVLRNLLANAVEAVKDAQDPRVAVLARHEAQAVRVSVLDNGPGVQAATDVFEPFVSGKPMGMGLGLAVSRAIAEAHGGSLVSVRGERGEFVLVLPCART
jgi:C4-dicarboxylate-specific signal transduction histidine kinase